MKYSVIIKNICKAALIIAYPKYKNFISTFTFCVTKSKKKICSHYQFNGLMLLENAISDHAMLIGRAIQKHVQNSIFSSVFDGVVVTLPGFVNFLLSLRCLQKSFEQQIHNLKLGIAVNNKAHKIIFDYSSPNVAKNLHIGHLRTTLIGDCLSRLFQHKGYFVLSLNHVGDWGTNFGLINAYLKRFVQNIDTVTLDDLECNYKMAKSMFSIDSEFAAFARKEVLFLQKNATASMYVWKRVCNLSIKKFTDVYKLLNVTICLRGESFYNYLLNNIVLYLESKRMVSLSIGAKCVYLKNFFNREGTFLPIILMKNDGAYNYNTTDLAAVYHRVFVEKSKHIVYITDVGQNVHFKMLFKLAYYVGFLKGNTVCPEHISCGLVLKKDGTKFKTRIGSVERLEGVLDEAVVKADNMLLTRDGYNNVEKRRKYASYIGVNSLKYHELMMCRTSDYVYNISKLLRLDGNTFIFVMYSYVRARSIQRNYTRKCFSMFYLIQTIFEAELVIHLYRYPCVFDKVITQKMPHILVEYMYELARIFNVFFENCTILGSGNESSRFMLCQAVAKILHECFALLGIPTVNYL